MGTITRSGFAVGGAQLDEANVWAALQSFGSNIALEDIQFPAIQVPSADANALDDYEEGTFTPTLMDDSIDGTGEGQVYVIQIGRYVKIGNHLYWTARLSTSSTGTLTGAQTARIGGFPFTSVNVANARFPGGVGFCGGLNIAATQSVSTVVQNNEANALLLLWDLAEGNSSLIISEFSSNGGVQLNGFYEV